MAWRVVRKLRKPGVSSYAGTNPRMVWRGKGKPKGRAPALPRRLRSAVTKIIKSKEETKYIATQLWDKATLDGAIHSIGTPGTNSDIMPLVPAIPVGALENQRIGRKVTPTKACVDLSLSFTMNGDPPYAQATQHLYVYVYMLRAKTFKNYGKMQTDGSIIKYLADNGDGTSVPFGLQDGSGNWYTNMTVFQRPIEASVVTQLRRVRVKLTKNQGIINGSAVPNAVTNLHTTSYSGRFYYKLPTLIYNDSDAADQAYPSNVNVFIAIGSALADNQDGLTSSVGGLVSVTGRQHVWFKDA